MCCVAHLLMRSVHRRLCCRARSNEHSSWFSALGLFSPLSALLILFPFFSFGINPKFISKNIYVNFSCTLELCNVCLHLQRIESSNRGQANTENVIVCCTYYPNMVFASRGGTGTCWLTSIVACDATQMNVCGKSLSIHELFHPSVPTSEPPDVSGTCLCGLLGALAGQVEAGSP